MKRGIGVVRRGQTAINAAWLIGMLVLFLIVYIILLPEADKDRLINDPSRLGQDYGSYYPSDDYAPSSRGRNLLSEDPGFLTPLHQATIQPLGAVRLYSVAEKIGETLASSLEVRRGFFSRSDRDIVFRLDDLQELRDASLLFFPNEPRGDLIIYLNDEEIFNAPASSNDVPLHLPIYLLGKVNRLTFSVSSPGLNFFQSNHYLLENLQLVKDYQREHVAEARSFVVSPQEFDSYTQFRLVYQMNCFTVTDSGTLQIILNGKVVAESLIVCDARETTVDLDPALLENGRNVLEFFVDRGQYVLEDLVLERFSGAAQHREYTFPLQLADLAGLDAGAHVFLSLRFVHDGLRKDATFFVNGFPVYVDTFDEYFEYDITPFVSEGRNVIRIVPYTPTNIVSMDVYFG